MSITHSNSATQNREMTSFSFYIFFYIHLNNAKKYKIKALYILGMVESIIKYLNSFIKDTFYHLISAVH